MFAWIQRAPRPSALGAPSPLLRHLAGDFAPQVAGFWPEPHTPFLAAPSARRHLLCLALATADPGAPAPVDAILALPLNQAVRLARPDAPPGLGRALSHIGERAWSAADYQDLLHGLEQPQTSKRLRHAELIGAEEVRALRRLPPALLSAGLGRFDLTAEASGLVAEAYHAILARDGAAVATACAARWGQAADPAGLANLVGEDIEPAPAAAPIAPVAPLRALDTREALHDAARRYQNCLRGCIAQAGNGYSAFYEWTEAPGAVVEIHRDSLYGWRLNQVRLRNNAPVVEPLRSAIIDAVSRMGVHHGLSEWELEEALRGAIEDRHGEPPLDAFVFGDQPVRLRRRRRR